MKILVLDGNENQAVACVRSLAHAGHDVSVGADTRWSKAGWSRYARNNFQYPSPRLDALKFVQSLVEEVKKVPGTLILPMTEHTTLPISAHRDLILNAGGRLVLPAHEAVLRAFDKQQTSEIAGSLGVSIPKTFTIRSLEDAEIVAQSITYPAVLKPRSSEESSIDGKYRSTGRPLYAANSSEFIDAFKALHSRSSAVLGQEFIEGTGIGFFALVSNGNVRGSFAHQRLRDVHPTGSGSSLRESLILNYKLQKISSEILNQLNWHGVAMVEFRRRPNGELVFLEVNGRFWNSLSLAIFAGADFPRWLAELAEVGDVEINGEYRAGVKCRWLLGDFRHLFAVLKGAPKGYTGKFPDRLKTLLKFLIPVPGTYHDNFMVTDPLPEIGDWLDFFLHKIPRRLIDRALSEERINGKERYSHS